MNKLAAVFALFLLLLLPRAPVHAGPLRIALLADTTIQTDTILLSHLLPPFVSPEIRQRAENVVLGAAPEIGNFRSLSREFLEASLQDADLPPESFELPEATIVRREGRRISKDDILRVLQSYLDARSSGTPAKITLDQISLQASISVPEGATHLRVSDYAFDDLLGCARFRISSSNPKAPPFYAWLSMSRTSHPGDPYRSHTSRDTSRAPNAPAPVESRRLAILYMHSENSSLVLSVRPLQSGSIGETIRVRVPANGHTLLARVAGPDRLEAAF
jgi:hypothetical protein